MFGKKDTTIDDTATITKIDPVPIGDEKPTPSEPPTNKAIPVSDDSAPSLDSTPEPAPKPEKKLAPNSNEASSSGEDWLDKEEDFEGQLTLDVYQDEENIVIKSTIAGVNPKDLDISINNDMLIVKGERKKEHEVKEDDYFYQECYWGAFSRSVILPMEVETDKIDATLKDGILTVKLPKSKRAKARKIEVKIGA